MLHKSRSCQNHILRQLLTTPSDPVVTVTMPVLLLHLIYLIDRGDYEGSCCAHQILERSGDRTTELDSNASDGMEYSIGLYTAFNNALEEIDKTGDMVAYTVHIIISE